jgi:hypothetical protein
MPTLPFRDLQRLHFKEGTCLECTYRSVVDHHHSMGIYPFRYTIDEITFLAAHSLTLAFEKFLEGNAINRARRILLTYGTNLQLVHAKLSMESFGKKHRRLE